MLEFPSMTERIVSQPSMQELARSFYEQRVEGSKDPFLTAISKTMSLHDSPTLRLAALTISRMQNTSFDDKWNTFVYSAWLEDRASFDMIGFGKDELKKSEASLAESKSQAIMFGIVQSNIGKMRNGEEVNVPNKYDIKVLYRKLLVGEYLKVVVDGQPLTYKAIALVISQQLGEVVTLENVDYAATLLREEKKAKRRVISDKDFQRVKAKVRKLRETGNRSTQQISDILKHKPNTVAQAIKTLQREGAIARRGMGRKVDAKVEGLLAKIFSEHIFRFPGEPINLALVARQLDLGETRIRRSYHRHAISREVPPLALGSWANALIIDYKGLIEQKPGDTQDKN